MRFAFIAACLVCANAFATTPAKADDPPADKPESSTGRTQTPETKGQKQPQGLDRADQHGRWRSARFEPAGSNSARHAARAGRLLENHRCAGEGQIALKTQDWVGSGALARSMRARRL
jgi:hypothetical protein